MTEARPLKVVVIVGSVRDGRIGHLVKDWFVGQAGPREDIELDVVDLAEAALPDGLRGHFFGERPEEVVALQPRLRAADAFVVIVPEYNRGYPAALKVLIDSYGPGEWGYKPVAFVSYGSMRFGGVMAAEQLRPVFTEVGATTIRDSVAFSQVWELFGEDGSWPREPEGCNAAAKVMLDQLTWWAHALRDARAARPIGR
ncbi:NADPH-dependent FMN reductase [Bailinhaonella thermotolerans]|uniref:NADPH-dependent oxidoreductase n=1 Tax=Bailinhaonella thermotolerans TaxID=1070861 RepID=A0A3A4B3I8_9ACTN|nr:NAD(P)H-dependent oxidoreductase [Bailinhaonella thermotolerans]RJL31950.1 NADPH-dependent oxidoreductase [Bailinhaonella thermotolerans]